MSFDDSAMKDVVGLYDQYDATLYQEASSLQT
jgi:hypothetical protein